jgi:NTE family protein
MPSTRLSPLLLACFLVLAGCATRFENAPLTTSPHNVERRVFAEAPGDRPVILLALSGGGARAADLGWSILRELRDAHYPALSNGSLPPQRRLIDDVAAISSVSGGSVLAAYFGLNGPDGLDAFGPAFLERDNMDDISSFIFNPYIWLDHTLSGTSRTELVENLFDQTLFHGATFRDLNQPGKPVILLNATDMASGDIFSFTPQRFDAICADLDAQPLASAVAASAAVPIVLAPVPFKNYAASDLCRDRPLPDWVRTTLANEHAPYVNLEAFRRARMVRDLRHGDDPYRRVDYLYLLDGGLVDNLAVRSLIEAASFPDAPIDIVGRLRAGAIKRLVIIVVNARATPPDPIDQSPALPDAWSMASAVASLPISATTDDTYALLRSLLRELRQAVRNNHHDGDFKLYDVVIDIDQLNRCDPVQRALQDKARLVPTSWTIVPDDRATIEATGRVLLNQNPCYRKLLTDLGAPDPGTDGLPPSCYDNER